MIRRAKRFGNSAHIIVPAYLIDHDIELKVENIIPPDKQEITWKEIEKKIEDAIYAAKNGYR